MYSSGELFQRSREGWIDVYFPSCELYNILFLTRHNDDKNDDEKDDHHTSTSCLIRWVYVPMMTPQSIIDDVTITR